MAVGAGAAAAVAPGSGGSVVRRGMNMSPCSLCSLAFVLSSQSGGHSCARPLYGHAALNPSMGHNAAYIHAFN